MTEYITIPATKRNFTVLAEMKGLSDDTYPYLPILWDDGLEILWDDGSTILWDDGGRFKQVKAAKRNFTIVAKVRE